MMTTTPTTPTTLTTPMTPWKTCLLGGILVLVLPWSEVAASQRVLTEPACVARLESSIREKRLRPSWEDYAKARRYCASGDLQGALGMLECLDAVSRFVRQRELAPAKEDYVTAQRYCVKGDTNSAIRVLAKSRVSPEPGRRDSGKARPGGSKRPPKADPGNGGRKRRPEADRPSPELSERGREIVERRRKAGPRRDTSERGSGRRVCVVSGRILGKARLAKYVSVRNPKTGKEIAREAVQSDGRYRIVRVPEGSWIVAPASGGKMDLLVKPSSRRVTCSNGDGIAADFKVAGVSEG